MFGRNKDRRLELDELAGVTCVTKSAAPLVRELVFKMRDGSSVTLDSGAVRAGAEALRVSAAHLLKEHGMTTGSGGLDEFVEAAERAAAEHAKTCPDCGPRRARA